jgi:signal transduction histidine kinase
VPAPKSIEERLRETYERSCDVVRIAHERAERAVARAALMQQALKHADARRPASEADHKTVSLLQLAVDEGARSIREKDRFLAVVVHELRQPLNAALAALSVLESVGDSQGGARAREVLKRQLHQMARLTEDLLDTSRLALKSMDMRMECIELRGIIQHASDALDAQGRERGLTIDIGMPPPGTCVWGDETRLRQVFSNLLSNAVRYTPSGGRVSVGTEVRGDRITVAVEDTGRGIAPEDVTRIFEPFARGMEAGMGGFGIGLFLVRGIVELHGGTVLAASAGIGAGSRFIVELPACPRHTAHS